MNDHTQCEACPYPDECGERRQCQRRIDPAAKLYPDDPYLQAEWLRAIRVVRTTSRGWLLDQPQGRRA